jgi:hypothetical protein
MTLIDCLAAICVGGLVQLIVGTVFIGMYFEYREEMLDRLCEKHGIDEDDV